MYAELTVQTEQNLPSDLSTALRAQWGVETDPAVAVPMTALGDPSGWVALVRYAQVTSHSVYLVFTPDPRTLKLHLASTVQGGSLRVLRDMLDDETGRVRTFLGRHGNAGTAFKAQIYAEGAYIQVGHFHSRMDRVQILMRDNLMANVYVPAVAFVMSIALRYELRASTQNAGAAVLALVLWVVGAVTFHKPAYQYTEVL